MFQEGFCLIVPRIGFFAQAGYAPKDSSNDLLLQPIVFPGILNDNLCFAFRISIIFVDIKGSCNKTKWNKTATLKHKKPYKKQVGYFHPQQIRKTLISLWHD